MVTQTIPTAIDTNGTFFPQESNSKESVLQVWNLKTITQAQFQALSIQDQLKYLAWYGVLAPSSHNTVPQRFSFDTSEYSITLHVNRKYVLPESDPTGRQALVSMGAVLENILQAASVFELKGSITFLSAKQKDFKPDTKNTITPLLKISFKKTKTKNNSKILQTMLKRKTVRAEYDNTVKLPTNLQTTLETTAKKYSPAHLHLITNLLTMRSFGKLQEQADRFVMENGKFAKELGNWLIPNTNTKNPIAMRGREFGFNDQFAQEIHDGLRQKTRLLPDQIAFFARGGRVGIENSSAVAVITVAKDSVEQQVKAGQLYEKLALELQQAGFVTAMHAGITEVDWVNAIFASSVLQSSERPTAVFRIGKPKDKKDLERPHSARPRLEELTIR